MPYISYDPYLWPYLGWNRISSYFLGPWSTRRMMFVNLTSSLTVLSQLHPLLWWYMIGVSEIIISEGTVYR